jgi:hypothetical protein
VRKSIVSLRVFVQERSSADVHERDAPYLRELLNQGGQLFLRNTKLVLRLQKYGKLPARTPELGDAGT